MIELKIEELEVASYLDDIEKYLKTFSLPSISEEIFKALPNGIESSRIMALLKREHEYSWILDLSEKVAAGNDGKGNSSYPERLESIVTSASLFEEEGEAKGLPYSFRESESCIPLSEDNTDKKTPQSIIVALRNAISSLKESKDYPNLFAAFDSLLEYYCSSLPSLSSGVSLYQRAKMKAAISSAMFVYAKEHDFDREAVKKKKIFALVTGDATGIQKYIFGVNTYKNSAKIIRARSFQIWIQSLLIAGHIARRMGLTNANIVTFSGGKFLLILPNIAKLEQVLDEVRCDLDSLCIDAYSGEIAYVVSSGVKCSIDGLDASNSDEIQKSMRLDSAEAKQKKLQKGIEKKGSQVLEAQYEKLSRAGEVCIACLSNASITEYGYCEECDYLIKLGRELNTEWHLCLNYEKIGSLKETVRLSKTSIAGFVTYSKSSYVKGMARITMPYYVPTFEYEVKTFNDLANEAEGVKKLAMFKADVDYLGLVFSSSLKERWSLSRYASLSSLFHFFFSETLVSLIKDKFPEIYVVFSGGDDVCLIGPWSDIVSFADAFHDKFVAYTAENKALTVSAGIVLFSDHDPILGVVDEAEEALECSKSAKKKNSVTIFSRTVSWDEYKTQLINAAILEKMKELSKSGLLYRILQYSDNAKDLSNGDIKLNDVRKALWLSHYTYSLKRSGIKDKDCYSLLKTYTEQDKIVNAKIATSIALYKNRGGK